MQFRKELRPRVQSGEVTCSVRIWKRPRVKVGGRYALPPGEIEVRSVAGISRKEISAELARRSGFDSVEAYEAYLAHPEHVGLVDRWRDHFSRVVVYDFGMAQ